MCHVSACPHLREGPASPQEVCLGFQGKSSIYQAAFSDMGDFESAFLFTCIWVDFFFFSSSFLMVFSEGSKWH